MELNEKVEIKWIGQSGYIISDSQTTICIDPYLSDSVEALTGSKRMVPISILPETLKVDAVICTHNHLDHLDPITIEKMDKKNVMFLAPADCKERLKELGVIHYIPFDNGSSVKIGKIKIDAVYAKHTIPAVGVLVHTGGYTLYFTGDTLYSSLLEKVKCDILFVCINGKLGNMSVSEAVLLTKKISPKVGVPNHYGMFLDNTEDPIVYQKNVDHGFIMQYNVSYDLSDMMGE